jgi:hypothetical protein
VGGAFSLYMCPHTIYVSSYQTIYVLILLYMCQVWRTAAWGGAALEIGDLLY